MAQMIRAILLARATAASLRGLRSSSCNNQVDADCLPGLATRIEQTRMAGAFENPSRKGVTEAMNDNEHERGNP